MGRLIEPSYFFCSGGQSGRTSIGLPSLCTVGAAELACPPAEGRIALFSIPVEVPVVFLAWSEDAADDGVLQLVSALSLFDVGVCASNGVAANSPAQTAAIS
ncbi:MAG: hypothetical protein AB7F72_18345 [Afipia sp.]